MADDPAYASVVQEYQQQLLDWRMSTEDPSHIAWTYRKTAQMLRRWNRR